MAGKVLITGASGFVGRAVARRLAAQGWLVRAASRSPEARTGGGYEWSALPAPEAPARDWQALVDGANHVIHCAGIAHATCDIPEAEYHRDNAVLTGALAAAAARRIGGRFVFMSSIRAVCGPVSQSIVTEATAPAPEDAYGRSKLAGERLVRAAFGESGRFTILRPVLVYGPEAKGNLAALLRLARLPVPLPLASIEARRSLLDLESLAAAAEHALLSPETGGRTFLVCDRAPVTIGEMVAALRRGLGVRPAIFPLPPALLGAVLAAARRREAWRRLSGPLVADSSALQATGWRAAENSIAGLEGFARGSPAD